MHNLNIATFQSNCYKTKKDNIYISSKNKHIAINPHMLLFSHYEMQIIVFFNLTIGLQEGGMMGQILNLLLSFICFSSYYSSIIYSLYATPLCSCGQVENICGLRKIYFRVCYYTS